MKKAFKAYKQGNHTWGHAGYNIFQIFWLVWVVGVGAGGSW